MEWFRVIGISITMIFIGYLVLRVIAKRSFNEMSIFNLFLVLMLANILSEPIRTDNFAELIIPTLVILIAYNIYSYLLRANKIGKNLKSEPIVLIRHGNINETGLKKAKITISEILADLRVKGFSHVNDVEFAILEETGKISVIPNSKKRPTTAEDLSIAVSYEGIPVPLIVDGSIQYDNLAEIRLSEEQLINRLGKQGYKEEMIKTISLAVLDETNNIIIDPNDDMSQGNIDQDQQTLIKKIQEDLQAPDQVPEDQESKTIDDFIK